MPLAPHDSQVIADLAKAVGDLAAEVRGYRTDIAVLHTKLFGDEAEENPKGRIPMAEAELVKHARQIGKMEPVVLVLRAIYALAIAAAGYAVHHFLPVKGQ